MQSKKLSILIPTFNYNVFLLVKTLHNQVEKSSIVYEILCFDDASTTLEPENEKINGLTNCCFKVLPKNIGRSAIRNLLAQSAKFENLLFLDADTLPVHENFISNYLRFINSEEKVVYGGIQYQKEKPKNEELLRWIYGNSREALPFKKRQENPYLCLLTLNFLISKSIFNKVTFNENIPNLRHEDTLFSFNLSQKNIKIIHIDNPILHLGLENSKMFLYKSEQAVNNLKYLINNNLINKNYTSISRIYFRMKAMKLAFIIRLVFFMMQPTLKNNLLGNKPSLILFDIYRLCLLFKSIGTIKVDEQQKKIN